jgi:hypothetical protein
MVRLIFAADRTQYNTLKSRSVGLLLEGLHHMGRSHFSVRRESGLNGGARLAANRRLDPRRALVTACEPLETRTLLSFATITNNNGGPSRDGALTVTVDAYGTFGINAPGSDALYDPLANPSNPLDNDAQRNTIHISGVFFEPAQQFLTETTGFQDTSFGLDSTVNVPLPSVPYTSQNPTQAVSAFDVAGFHIVLTQSVSGQSLTQSYTITNVSNVAFDNVPFRMTHALFSYLTWNGANTGQDWGGISADGKIAVALDGNNGTNVPYVRINSTETAGSVVGVTTAQGNRNYFATITANNGARLTDDRVVVNDTNGDRFDDRAPAATVGNEVVLAQANLVTVGLGQTVTYTTVTKWGETGTTAPGTFVQPGVFEILRPPQVAAPVFREGTNAAFTIARTGGALGAASVEFSNWKYWQTTATAGSDFQPLPADLTDPSVQYRVQFADGDTASVVTFQIIDDVQIEGDEFGDADIRNPSPGSTIKNTPERLSFTIPNNDTPSPFHFIPTQVDQLTTVHPQEGQTINITVRRDGTITSEPGPYGKIAVMYRLSSTGAPGSATLAGPGADVVDLTPTPGVLTFDIGVNEQTITLQIPDDVDLEGAEAFTITLINDNPLLLTAPFVFPITIGDNEPLSVVKISTATDRFPESAGGTNTTWNRVVSVVRTGDLNSRVTVSYVVAGGTGAGQATPNADFTVPGATFDAATNTYTGVLTFDVGQTTPTVPLVIRVVDDGREELDESLSLALQTPPNLPGLIGTPSGQTLTITNDDTPGRFHFVLPTDPVVTTEATEATDGLGRAYRVLTFQVARDAGSQGAVSVDYAAIGDTATAGADLEAVTGTLTWADGDASVKTFAVRVYDDAVAEGDERFTLVLRNSGDASIISPAAASVVVHDNDSIGMISFASPTFSASEKNSSGGAGTAVLRVNRVSPAGLNKLPWSFNYVINAGTATAGTDYGPATVGGTTGFTGRATGGANEDFIDITIPLVADGIIEGSETFSVQLATDLANNLGAPSTAIVTIVDADQPSVVQLSVTTDKAYENGGTTQVVRVRRLSGSNDVTFFLSTSDGSAVAGTDYVAVANNFTLPGSANELVIPIQILDNAAADGSRSFGVSIAGATGGTIGGASNVPVTISDDESTFAVASGAYRVNRNAGFARVTVTRAGGTDSAVRVFYATRDLTATAGQDFTSAAGSFIDFAPGEVTKVVEVPVIDNPNVLEDTETFAVDLTSLGVVTGTAANTINGTAPIIDAARATSTISLAGGPTVTGVQLATRAGRLNRIERVIVSFSGPLDPATTNQPLSYILTTVGTRGRFNSRVQLMDATYDPATNSVTLFPKKTLVLNRLYQLSLNPNAGLRDAAGTPVLTGTPGGLGGTQVAVFGRGTKIQYGDRDGDVITYQVKRGGYVDLIYGLSGGEARLGLIGTTAGRSVLTGLLGRSPAGNKTAIIDQITNAGSATIQLASPPFSIQSVA